MMLIMSKHEQLKAKRISVYFSIIFFSLEKLQDFDDNMEFAMKM